jgi:glycosyltransferase involved in cell wall biosynthesis
LKAPGNLFLSWTKMQWCRLVDKTIARFTHSYPVSIIHAHTGSVSSWASIQAAKRHRIPCVVTYHGSEVHTALADRRKGWQLCRDSFGAADLNLPVSKALETILRSSIQPTGRCETLLLGVDQRRFFPSSELVLEPQVLYVGRIERM